MNAQVHAPYHFVPLSKWIYLPEWAHLVSHDYPFKDGLSGSIELKLKNSTDLLVGAESVKEGNQPSLVKWARTPDGQLVIPGSSLKGMLRSFLEVATFSKFKQLDDNRYAYRDISGSDTKYSNILKNTDVQAAWLSFDADNNTWFYRKCKHTRLYNEEFNAYLQAQCIDKALDNTTQNALDKYHIWPLNKSAIAFDFGEYFTQREKPRQSAVKLGLEDGPKKGVPIFVGLRPGQSRDLHFNYIFFDVKEEQQKIDAKLVNQMFDAHDESLVNYLKANGHPDYGIPIFIRASGDEIKALGLAKMPKMLYEKSVADLARAQQGEVLINDTAFDFCELIFGTLRDHGVGLKSRVSFSDLLCKNEAITTISSAVILGQPKASYLNAYLEQNHTAGRVNGELKMYEQGAQLAGWKRYPTQTEFNDHLPYDLRNKTNVQSRLELLTSGAEFIGKIVFHNLKPEELGALLWAINPNESFYHGLGHGKSLGAGAIQLEATLNLREDGSAESFDMVSLIQGFIQHMDNQHPAQGTQENAWQNSTQVLHLLAFGNMQDNQDKNLTYMPLQKNADIVSYSNSKVSGSRKALPNWQKGQDNLSRDEAIGVKTDYAPQGRLFELIGKLVSDQSVLESIGEAQKKQAEDAKLLKESEQRAQEAAALQARMEKASLLFADFLSLAEFFKNNQGKDNLLNPKHQEITQFLKKIHTPEHGLSEDEIKEIVGYLSEIEPTRYLNDKTAKISKNKLKERKTLIQNLSHLL
ncbi:MAG: TIGR03986 family CRISPR-associated RAMP protein [Alcaligenaceae bacterium]|nr:TIGR03986 family CRISPR-associated RAMP protein [Alcaligenaceae bacterium]